MARHGNRRAPLSVWLATPVEWSGSALAETDGGGEEQAELGQPGHQQLRPGQRGKGQQQPQQSYKDGADDSECGGCEAGGAAINARAGFAAAGKKQLAGRGGGPMSQPDRPIMRAGGGVVA